MKIVFFPNDCIPFHAQTLDERPIGGIETATIRLAEALAKLEHKVIVISGIENPPLSNPLYLPMRALGDIGPTDALIAVRGWKPLLIKLQAKKRFLWTGDSYDQPQNIGIGDYRIRDTVDCLLPVSEWHGKRLSEESGFPADKIHVLRNGIHLPYFEGTEKRVRKRLIYSSTPYRGLVHLPSIFREIRDMHPDAELHVFSGYKVYSGPSGYNESALKEFHVLAEELSSISGCTVHDNITQSQLAREFMRSSVLAYPNIFEETSCITAMEAQAAGCVVVTSRLAALPETIGTSGILIDPPAGTSRFQREFVTAVDKLLSDDEYFTLLSKRGQAHTAALDWNTIARDFSYFLLEYCIHQSRE